MKRVMVLGSTGSIGVQALEVLSSSPELTIVGLSCGSRTHELLVQAEVLGVSRIAVADSWAARRVNEGLYTNLELWSGPGAVARLVREVEADLVLNAIVGFAGLEPTLAALEKGVPVALANKESLVSGGRLVTGIAGEGNNLLIPVDSEHSALFQLLEGEEKEAVTSLILTASGGPFRGRRADDLVGVTPEEALDHPTWDMGAKITIDSATLMNKGLEVIEAHHLFDVPYDSIEVVIHPQSLVHSLVRLVDGSVLSHMGVPDMRVPISYALNYPKRRAVPVRPFDLVREGTLDFSSPDVKAFPCLALAMEAGRQGDAATCALNAANEVAVRAFLERNLPFPGIPRVIEEVLERLEWPSPSDFEEVRGLDAWARSEAERFISLES